jgi:hypothetical protein
MNKSDKFWLYGSILFFTLMCLNIVVGKLVIYFDLGPVLLLGDVGEFLVLLAAVVCFVVVLVKQEAKVIK